ncbi:hypothetical protein [Agromyces aerolatus]|uniref:hypothetical protein n=1 Tax=Agromyces sp. LY-1074 TaxID=3074080 RepID=UPI00285A46FE|nr:MULTISPECIES: hypothetical protein [unclassified Agromyces]MDR5701872.1 hypothetical protein [Agromyces sp. LY-1074]MDR5708114.1 hypothetical protein [Agromyces sp. LY-1358]
MTAIAVLGTLAGCWNAHAYLVEPPIPQPGDLVGAWVNSDDGGRIDFHADETCRLSGIPTGALKLEPAGADGKPIGMPIDTAACTWRVADNRAAIHLSWEGRGTTLVVLRHDGTEIGFSLGDPDTGDLYPLEKRPRLRSGAELGARLRVR